jgi:hypothetical protein
MIRIYPSGGSFDDLRLNTWCSFVLYEAFLDKAGLSYSQTSGSSALIVQGDDNALLAAKETMHYPYDMVVELLRKDTLPAFMSTHGFNALETKRVYSVLDIAGFSNFIVKPVIGCNSRASVWMGTPPDFVYKRFISVDDLLIGRDKAEIDLALASGNYCIQQAVMSGDFEQVTISGSVNGKGEVYFRRNATWVWKADVLTSQHRERSTYATEQALLAPMLSTVRNAAFGVQFIVMDGKLYPIDWNFRDPGRTVKVELALNPAEFEQALAHQFDIPHDKVLASDVWDTVMSENFDNAVHTVRAAA